MGFGSYSSLYQLLLSGRNFHCLEYSHFKLHWQSGVSCVQLRSCCIKACSTELIWSSGSVGRSHSGSGGKVRWPLKRSIITPSSTLATTTETQHWLYIRSHREVVRSILPHEQGRGQASIPSGRAKLHLSDEFKLMSPVVLQCDISILELNLIHSASVCSLGLFCCSTFRANSKETMVAGEPVSTKASAVTPSTGVGPSLGLPAPPGSQILSCLSQLSLSQSFSELLNLLFPRLRHH